MEVTKAIIPVAGYGTRMLPFTKSIEKCMLPLGDKPVIDRNVDACVEAGITDIMIVVSAMSQQVRTYYGHNPEMQRHLDDRGKFDVADSLEPRNDVNIHFVEQDLSDGKYGTSLPVWLCRDLIDIDEQFLVVNGDQYMYRKDGSSELADFIKKVHGWEAESGMIVVERPPNDSQRYGLILTNPDYTLAEINEHPEPFMNITGDFKNTGNYLLNGRVFGLLEEQISGPPNDRGEYYLTDIVNQVAKSGRVVIMAARGQYLDCGSMDTWLEANDILRNASKP